MLSLRRFKSLVDSYGADPRRWPSEVRDDAQALLEVSADARGLLGQARRLDKALAASSRHHAEEWQIREQAALARLQSSVEARIAPAEQRSTDRGSNWTIAAIRRTLVPNLPWVGVATAGSVAVAAGLVIGGLYTSALPPASDALLSMLEPAPIHFLAE